MPVPGWLFRASFFWFIACGGVTPNAGVDAGDAAAETSGPTTELVGQVVDRFGIGLPNVEVLIDGQQAKTDAQGKFSVSAAATYDAVVVFSEHPGNAFKRITKFVGLGTRSPRLQVDALAGGNLGELAGILSGPGAPPASPSQNDVLVLFFSPAKAPPVNSVEQDNIPYSATQIIGGAYPSFPVYIPDGANASAGTLHALYMTPADGTLRGYGNVPATAVAKGSSQANVPMDAVSTTTSLQGTVQWADGFGGNLFPVLYVDGQLETLPGQPTISGSSATFQIPTFTRPGFAWGVVAVGRGSSQWRVGLPPSASNIALAPPPSPTILSPDSGAGVDESTDFTWTTLASHASVFHVECSLGPRINLTFVATVVTMGNTARLPTAPSLGVTFPSGQPGERCESFLSAFDPVSNVDEFSARWLESAWWGFGGHFDGSEGGVWRDFVTK